jgi:hypothetical protein
MGRVFRLQTTAISFAGCFFGLQTAATGDDITARIPKISKLLPVVRPAQSDVDIIQMVATLGASETISLPEGTNLLNFISGKCGRPSDIVPVHPTYLNLLLSRNKELANENLTSLNHAATISLPACARFGRHAKPLLAQAGVYSLVASLSLPFDTTVFQTIAKNKSLREEVRKLGKDVVASKFSQQQTIDNSSMSIVDPIISSRRVRSVGFSRRPLASSPSRARHARAAPGT